MGPLPADKAFGSLMLSEPVARAIAEMGYITPTPIQEAAIPVLASGKDLVGQAQTGTGKTASFGIPLADKVDASVHETQAIILVPTRELAQQVSAELTKIMQYRGIRVACVYGGQPIAGQIKTLERGAHVVVGTPGRVLDHLERRTLQLDRIRTIILDEADQMLDIGFLPDIRRILQHTPKTRQTALFSATVPTPIHRLIYSYLKDPQWVKVGLQAVPVAEVRQIYAEVADRDKPRALEEVLTDISYDQALLFRRTQIGVDKAVHDLARRGFAIEGIHGSMPQGKRNSVMRDFREGRVKILVATNLASRGLDIPAVSTVINYDIPDNVEEYVHRIGRTARMGRKGTAITFVGEWDADLFEAIKKLVGEQNLEPYKLKMYNRAATSSR